MTIKQHRGSASNSAANSAAEPVSVTGFPLPTSSIKRGQAIDIPYILATTSDFFWRENGFFPC
jgi:hypothetical protein